jgi:FtsP/CotA-like multicopper oxidase with cupredoxin domain
MHIHGGPFEIIATDETRSGGASIVNDTVNVGPRERYDVVWTVGSRDGGS